MIEQHEVEVLGRVTLVSLHGIHLWTARKKISAVDFPNVEFPPEQLMSLGSKHVLDPEQLKTFERCKREAHSECIRVGVKFLGGYAVPEEKLNDLLVKLRVIKSAFMDYKTTFMRNYDQYTSDWANADWKKPEWRDMILRSLTPKAEVACKFDFAFTAMKIVPHPDEELSNELGDEVKGLTSELIKEVSNEAREMIKRGLLTRGTATQGTVNTLRKIAEKIDGLSFLSPYVKVVSEYFSTVINAMPTQGAIKDNDFQALSSLVVSISSEYGLKQFMSAAKQNHANNDDPFDFLNDIATTARLEFMPSDLNSVHIEINSQIGENETIVTELNTPDAVSNDTPLEVNNSVPSTETVDEQEFVMDFNIINEKPETQIIKPEEVFPVFVPEVKPPAHKTESLTFDW